MSKTPQRKAYEVLGNIIEEVFESGREYKASELISSVKSHRLYPSLGLAESTLLSYLSNLTRIETSPLMKLSGRNVYMKREAEVILSENGGKKNGGLPVVTNGQAELAEGVRNEQLEEKLRAFYIRYQEMKMEDIYPKHIEHTKAKRGRTGQNRWKFPDVVCLEWDTTGAELPELYDLKKEFGEKPFRVLSVELKVQVTLANVRAYFFQTLSNSRWANTAHLVIGYSVTDDLLLRDLRSLGQTYQVSIYHFNFTPETLDALSPAQKIASMDDEAFGALSNQIRLNPIVEVAHRDTMDWRALGDLASVHPEFEDFVKWCWYCVHNKKATSFHHYHATVTGGPKKKR